MTRLSPWTLIGICSCMPLLVAFLLGWMARIAFIRRKKIMAALKEPAE